MKGNVTPVTGTISVTGLTVTGTGTSFTTDFVEGDLIRATPVSRLRFGLVAVNPLRSVRHDCWDLPRER